MNLCEAAAAFPVGSEVTTVAYRGTVVAAVAGPPRDRYGVLGSAFQVTEGGPVYIQIRWHGGDLGDQRPEHLQLVGPILERLNALNAKFPVGARVQGRGGLGTVARRLAGQPVVVGGCYYGSGGRYYVAIRWDDGGSIGSSYAENVIRVRAYTDEDMRRARSEGFKAGKKAALRAVEGI